MTDLELPRVPGVTRVGTAAAWVSGISCLPYLALKVLWTVGVPLGISDESVLGDIGWVLSNALMAVVQLLAVALVVALARPWSRRLPPWLLLFPAWVGTGVLFQVMIGSAVGAALSGTSQDPSSSDDPIRPWVYVLVYVAFALQGTALAVVFAAHVRARWGRLFTMRTSEVVDHGRKDRVSSWSGRNLVQITVAVASMALGTAIVFSSWSGAGAFALSGTDTERSVPMQVARATGAAVAALGMFALAGRWGARLRFWWPAALVWVGSGALVVFDGLSFLLNGLFVRAGAEAASDATWELTDTVLAAKVLVGVLAAAVGVLALSAAAAGHASAQAEPAQK
ncbi:hypothetical protein [Nocardioides sp.]|uniref:hypothetical protein n=1 Tax=Nocardioides sp. TaxID=35761 RepID=UPI0026311100|nr:hypothetical protein [Nocardioides sp.]MDI6909823.1 hypothetical protein [Nocardioides sp.]